MVLLDSDSVFAHLYRKVGDIERAAFVLRLRKKGLRLRRCSSCHACHGLSSLTQAHCIPKHMSTQARTGHTLTRVDIAGPQNRHKDLLRRGLCTTLRALRAAHELRQLVAQLQCSDRARGAATQEELGGIQEAQREELLKGLRGGKSSPIEKTNKNKPCMVLVQDHSTFIAVSGKTISSLF